MNVNVLKFHLAMSTFLSNKYCFAEVFLNLNVNNFNLLQDLGMSCSLTWASH